MTTILDSLSDSLQSLLDIKVEVGNMPPEEIAKLIDGNGKSHNKLPS